MPTQAKDDAPPARRHAEDVQTTFTEQQAATALARCQHYVTAGIDEKHITAFQEDWAVNAVSMLPHQERCGTCCYHK